MTKAQTKLHIKEYAGSSYLFLIDYIERENELEAYLENQVNLNKIIYKNVYGILRLKSEYRNINANQLSDYVLQTCKDTIEYIKKLRSGNGNSEQIIWNIVKWNIHLS